MTGISAESQNHLSSSRLQRLVHRGKRRFNWVPRTSRVSKSVFEERLRPSANSFHRGSPAFREISRRSSSTLSLTKEVESAPERTSEMPTSDILVSGSF